MRIETQWLVSALVVAGLADGSAVADATPPPPAIHIMARYPIGGNEGGYDYLDIDSLARRLYVTHATQIEVLDLDTGKLVGHVGGMHGVHGVELVPPVGKGYSSDGLDRAITVFDPVTLAVKTRIGPTGVKPDAIRYDADTKRLFVVNGGSSGDISVIEPATDTIVDTIKLGGGKLEQIGFDGRGHAFVNDEAQSVIHVFETRTLKPLTRWPLAPCTEPTGMAVDSAHHRVFAACANQKLAILDTDDGHIVAMVTIGNDPDGAAFDVRAQLIFTSNNDGTLSVTQELTPDHYRALAAVNTGPGARTIALDEKTGRLFLPTARSGDKPNSGGKAPIIPESFAVLVVGPIN